MFTNDWGDDNNGRFSEVYVHFNDSKAHDPKAGCWNMNPSERAKNLSYIGETYCYYLGELIRNCHSERERVRVSCKVLGEDEAIEEYLHPDPVDQEIYDEAAYHADPTNPEDYNTRKFRGNTTERKKEIIRCQKIISLYRRELKRLIRANNRTSEQLGCPYEGPSHTLALLIQDTLQKILGRIETIEIFTTISSLKSISLVLTEIMKRYVENISNRFLNYKTELLRIKKELSPYTVISTIHGLIALLDEFNRHLHNRQNEVKRNGIYDRETVKQYDTYDTMRDITSEILEELQNMRRIIQGMKKPDELQERIGQQKLSPHLVSLRRQSGKAYKRKTRGNLDHEDGEGSYIVHSPESQEFSDKSSSSPVFDKTFYSLENSGLLNNWGSSQSKG